MPPRPVRDLKFWHKDLPAALANQDGAFPSLAPSLPFLTISDLSGIPPALAKSHPGRINDTGSGLFAYTPPESPPPAGKGFSTTNP